MVLQRIKEVHDRAAGFEAFMIQFGGGAVLLAAAAGKPLAYFGRRFRVSECFSKVTSELLMMMLLPEGNVF